MASSTSSAPPSTPVTASVSSVWPATSWPGAPGAAPGRAGPWRPAAITVRPDRRSPSRSIPTRRKAPAAPRGEGSLGSAAPTPPRRSARRSRARPADARRPRRPGQRQAPAGPDTSRSDRGPPPRRRCRHLVGVAQSPSYNAAHTSTASAAIAASAHSAKVPTARHRKPARRAGGGRPQDRRGVRGSAVGDRPERLHLGFEPHRGDRAAHPGQLDHCRRSAGVQRGAHQLGEHDRMAIRVADHLGQPIGPSRSRAACPQAPQVGDRRLPGTHEEQLAGQPMVARACAARSRRVARRRGRRGRPGRRTGRGGPRRSVRRPPQRLRPSASARTSRAAALPGLQATSCAANRQKASVPGSPRRSRRRNCGIDQPGRPVMIAVRAVRQLPRERGRRVGQVGGAPVGPESGRKSRAPAAR